MSPQEVAMLEKFLDQLVQVRGIRKVPQADELIRRAVGRQPDAAYLLVQRSLMLERALEQAKARIAELELTEQSDGKFLDTGATNAPVAMPRAAATTIAAPPASAAMPSEPSQGSGGSFLGQAAATAAGVAGGAFLFEGIESLLGPRGASLPGQAAQPFTPEDVTINNYYSGDDRHAPQYDQPDRFIDDDAADSDSDFDDDDGDSV